MEGHISLKGKNEEQIVSFQVLFMETEPLWGIKEGLTKGIRLTQMCKEELGKWRCGRGSYEDPGKNNFPVHFKHQHKCTSQNLQGNLRGQVLPAIARGT